MGASFNKGAYKEIYKHNKWIETADKYEEQFAAKLYKTPYVQDAAKTALTKLSKTLNAYYGNRGQKMDEETVENAEAVRDMAGQIVGEVPKDQREAGGEERVEITDTLLEAFLPRGDSSHGAGQIGNFSQSLTNASTMEERQEAEATDRRNLDEVINGDGNLRERMTMLYNGMFINGGREKQQIAKSRSLKNLMAYITQDKIQNTEELQGVRLDLLEGMKQRGKRGDVFDIFSIARDLKKSSDHAEKKGNKLTRFFAGLSRGFNAGLLRRFNRKTRSAKEREQKRLGEDHYNNLGLELSRRERINGIKDGQLQWEEGTAWFKMKKPVNAGGMLQTAGPSGTALRMLGAYKLLGASLKELLHFRLALIAWMVTSKDHSLYEIMKGSQNAGITGKEDLSEPATMYMTVDPLPVDVLRREFAPEHQFPHELVYKTMLNELTAKRKQKADFKLLPYTLFANMGDNDATNKDAQDLALNIYTTNAFLAMVRGQKYGTTAGKRSLSDKKGGYEGRETKELRNFKMRNSIFNMLRISSRMAQDTLEERGQNQEEDILAEEMAMENNERPSIQGKAAYKGTAYRGGKLTSDLKEGGNTQITLPSMTSSSKNYMRAAEFYLRIGNIERAVLIEYKMTGKGAVDISGTSKYKEEEEVLIPANTKFRVVTPLKRATITKKGIQWDEAREEPDNSTELESQEEEDYLAGQEMLPVNGYVIRLEEVEGPGYTKRNEQGEVPQMRREIRNAYRQEMERRRGLAQRQ